MAYGMILKRALLKCLLLGYSLYIIKTFSGGWWEKEDIWNLHRHLSFQMNAWVGKRNTDFLIYKYIFLCFICRYYMEVLWISTEMTACVFSWSFALILFQWQFVMFCITNTCYSKCSMFEQCFSYKLSDDLTLCAKRFPHPWVDRAICMICIKFWDCIFTEKKCMCNLSLASYMFFIIWV